MKWEKIKYDTSSSYDGSLRYMSSCIMSNKKILLSGGCLISTHAPSSAVYEMNMRSLSRNVKKKSMNIKRYGHSSVFLSGFVYSIGGFSHKDLP